MSSERKGILAIVYRNFDSFLVVNTKNENISFVAGETEEGETDEEAVVREIKEESGIDADRNKIKKLPFVNKFTYNKGFLKGVKGIQNVYLVKVDKVVEINPEAIDVVEAKWMTKNELRKNLTFDHVKEIFEKSLKYMGE